MKLLEHPVRGSLVAVACFSCIAQAGLFTDPDPNWKEGEHALPAALDRNGLRELAIDDASRNRFLVDEHSLSVGDDGVVRYVLVVRTAGGAENVTFEGIRCEIGGWRIYATGRADGRWSRVPEGAWLPIVDTSYNRARAALAKDYFCDGATPPRDRDEVLRRVRSGGAQPVRGA